MTPTEALDMLTTEITDPFDWGEWDPDDEAHEWDLSVAIKCLRDLIASDDRSHPDPKR